MMLNWMLLPLKRPFDFKGRSRRKEYWLYFLLITIVSLVLSTLDELFSLKVADIGILSTILSVLNLVPGLAVSVRRLHDVNLSGWWLLSILVAYVALGLNVALNSETLFVSLEVSPAFVLLMTTAVALLVMTIVFLVLACRKGTEGPNRFGEDPLVD